MLAEFDIAKIARVRNLVELVPIAQATARSNSRKFVTSALCLADDGDLVQRRIETAQIDFITTYEYFDSGLGGACAFL